MEKFIKIFKALHGRGSVSLALVFGVEENDTRRPKPEFCGGGGRHGLDDPHTAYRK